MIWSVEAGVAFAVRPPIVNEVIGAVEPEGFPSSVQAGVLGKLPPPPPPYHPIAHTHLIRPVTSPATRTVVSLSACNFVIANAIPVEKYSPWEKSMLKPPEAGMGIVHTGVSVPTVGAEALLYSFRNTM